MVSEVTQLIISTLITLSLRTVMVTVMMMMMTRVMTVIVMMMMMRTNMMSVNDDEDFNEKDCMQWLPGNI